MCVHFKLGTDLDASRVQVLAPAEDDGTEMDMELEEDAPPLPSEDGKVYSAVISPPPDDEPPPMPDEAPPLPEEHSPIEDENHEPELPPLPSEPILPFEAHLPTEESVVPPPLPEAAELMLTALAGRATSPVPTSTAPAVKRKEYRAEPVYVAPVFSPEPVQPETFIPHQEPTAVVRPVPHCSPCARPCLVIFDFQCTAGLEETIFGIGEGCTLAATNMTLCTCLLSLANPMRATRLIVMGKVD